MSLLKTILPALIGLLLAVQSPPAVAAGAPTIEDFKFMEGHWLGRDMAGLEEIWLAPALGVISGMMRWPSAGGSGRYVLEFLTIVEEKEGIKFYFKHFDPDVTAWEKEEANTYRLVGLKDDCARFELMNVNAKVPAVFQYCRLDDVTLEFRAVDKETPLAESDFVLTFKARGTVPD